MLKRLYIAILSILAVTGMQAEDLTLRADSAYMADDYTTALALYEEAVRTDGTSAELWYNIGNTQYRLGNLGKAILAYERSLRIDPANENTRANLAFVSSKTIDKTADKGTFISNASDSIATAMSANAWAWVAFICFALMLAGVALYIFTMSISLRKIGFFSAIALAVVTAVSVIIAIRAAGIATSTTEGVVTAKSTILSTSPRTPKDRTEEAMLLHEGTRVSIVDSVSVPSDTTGLKWYDVKIDNAHRAWIRSTDIEKI